MSNKYFALLPIAVLISGVAHAAPANPYYVGVRLGDANYSHFEQNNHASNLGLKQNDLSGGIFVGYNLTPWFAVETGYTALGEAHFSSQKIKLHAFDLTGKATWHLNNSWGLFAKAGGSYMLTDYHSRNNRIKDIDDHLVGTVGAGVEYQLTDHLSTRAEYQYYHDLSSKPRGTDLAYNFDTNFYGLSLVYNWGAAPVVDTIAPAIAQTVTIEPSTLSLDYGVNQYKLTAANERTLQPMAKRLTRYPSATIVVTGYTSNTGTAAYNQALSEKRAHAVASELAKYVTNPAQVTAQGMGEQHPITTNATAEGRAQNRRVEITSPALKIATEAASER
ncbi:OmpA family protein [Photobacterium iliopiscarium]|uniref:OmpA family protein n=1 Tax=Photobacterium iliopiscarium TaxID=56192 RepID=UPI0024314FC4|nr:OmpA family protein [Photobacterium iliopiscarium]